MKEELIKLKVERLEKDILELKRERVNRIKAGHFVIESTEESVNELIKKMPKLIDSTRNKKLNDIDLDDENYIG